tara:strand:- start:130 stop:288 length:159 start_codon:yes stop_codon:yes gene_type:complete
MRVKIFLTIELDEEDYPIPVDGMVEEDVDETVRNLIHDVDGMIVKSLKIIME